MSSILGGFISEGGTIAFHWATRDFRLVFATSEWNCPDWELKMTRKGAGPGPDPWAKTDHSTRGRNNDRMGRSLMVTSTDQSLQIKVSVN